MKLSVPVTLILAGTALILAPFVSGFLYENQLASLLARPGTEAVTLLHGIPGQYNWACLLVGVGMVVAGVRQAEVERRSMELAS